MAASSVNYSCESILEYYVSRYENHFNIRRSVDEETANEKNEVTVNGPILAKHDGVVREAMDNYWREKGGGRSISS